MKVIDLPLNYKNLLILIVLGFCGYACYTDIRWGKIKNYCSYGLIYVGLLAQVIFLIQRDTTLSYIPQHHVEVF